MLDHVRVNNGCKFFRETRPEQAPEGDFAAAPHIRVALGLRTHILVARLVGFRSHA